MTNSVHILNDILQKNEAHISRKISIVKLVSLTNLQQRSSRHKKHTFTVMIVQLDSIQHYKSACLLKPTAYLLTTTDLINIYDVQQRLQLSQQMQAYRYRNMQCHKAAHNNQCSLPMHTFIYGRYILYKMACCITILLNKSTPI